MSASTFGLQVNKAGFRRDVASPRSIQFEGACDCHLHIVGPLERYPYVESALLRPPEARLENYLAMQRVLGLSRCVVVQPSFFGTDNRCTLDAVDRIGASARAVVVLDLAVGDVELQRMHEAGARGVRVNLVSHGGPSLSNLPAIAERIRPLGWHMQVFADSRALPAMAAELCALRLPLVFDHMAHTAHDQPVHDEGVTLLCRWLQMETAWVKLSAYRFPGSAERAHRLVEANAARVVWGTDWPHVAYEHPVPEEGGLFDELARWVPDDDTRRRILVDNPSALYFD